MTTLLFTVGVLLLVVSALLSSVETAAFSIRAARIRTLTEEGFRGAERLAAVRSDQEPIRSTLFILNTLLNVVAGGMLTAAAAFEWGWIGAGVALPAAAGLVLILGELVPRAVAARRPIRLALAAAPLLEVVSKVARPVLYPFVRLEGLVGRPETTAGTTPAERELMELTDLGQEEGVVELEEQALVERAFRLDELTAFDVMTPRVDIFAWPDSLTLADIVAELNDVPYSRVPVYGDDIDDVTGILYVREAYATYVAGRTDVRLSEIARIPFFVPGTLSLTRLLNDFQARRIHMGIVADEFGGTDGLVTLEDVIEELVGEIEDETDIAEEPIFRVSKNEIVVDAGIDVREINYALNLSLPHLENRSLNGLILDGLGRVPAEGEVVELGNLRVEILEATETQVRRASLSRVQVLEAES